MHPFNAIANSNNSVNENRYNSEKLIKSSAVYKLKKILKPIVTLLKKKQELKQKDLYETAAKEFHSDYEYDNSANERLEAQLISEIEACQNNAAIFVLQNDDVHLQPMHPEELYVPVHFARTEAGTFFWTTMTRDADSDLVQPCYCFTEHQHAEQEFADRWAQA